MTAPGRAARTPTWTVVIPTYDRHETLTACLARLAPGAQTLDSAQYEVVVTDDARSPATRALLADRFPWVRYTEGPARGPAANRNHGAAQAQGGWIAFTDDDTLPSREWLAAYARALEVHPTAQALEGRTTCNAGFGTPMHYAPVNERGGRFWSCNIAVRAERFRALSGFDEGFTVAHMEDQDLRERLKGAGVTIHWVPEAVVDHAPRRQPSGRTLGLQRAAEVRYLYKHGAPRPVRWRLLRGVASLRVGIVRSLPFTLDSVSALASLASELWAVWSNATDWERAASAEFPVPDPMRVAPDALRAQTSPQTHHQAHPPALARTRTSVSVIVPAYQRPLALARCLRALATQQRAPDEVIVVTREGDDATWTAARAVVFPARTRVELLIVRAPGVIAAMQAGLDRATSDYIALTDDDAEPRADWIALLASALDADATLGGVGGRDWQPHERGDAHDVGRVQWFGRVIGRHHLGAGPARDVDVLKGVNCCFRARALRAVGFDARLRGDGAQVHWELATCLPMRRAGWRLRYDPAIAVEHHVAARSGADQVHRGAFAAAPYTDAVHNEALVLGEHVQGCAHRAFVWWSALAGTTSAPGLLAALRLRAQGHAWAWEAWRAARAGRALARATHRMAPRA